jgi:LacI family transcriptional regulator
MSDSMLQPLHAKIRDQFHHRIATGVLSPGDRLPPETQLMAEFNVSRGTVSRALRDLEQLGVLDRRRGAGTFVRKKHPAGGTLTSRHLAMLMPWATTGQSIGFVQSQIHHRLSSVCSEHDLLLSLQCLSAQGSTLRERILGSARALLARNIKTVLFCPAELPHGQMHWNREAVDLLLAGGANVVLMDREIATPPQRSELTWVSFDNRRGGAMLVQHLVEQGYRRIAFVGIPWESSAVTERMHGYLEGLRACGLGIDERLIFSPAEVDEAFCDHLLGQAGPDAVICKGAPQAAALSRQLGERGRRIGPEIGLAAFDDEPFAAMLPVPLTVIRQPVEPFVAALFRVLWASLVESQEPFEGEQIVVRTELVPRASSCRIPA